MGLFSGVGSIIGGISGADDEAPVIFDEFKPRSVFRGGIRGGGRTLRIAQTNQGGSRFVLGRNRAARRSFAGLERLQGGFGKTLGRSRRRFGRLDRDLRRLSRRIGTGLVRARVKPIKRAGRQAVGNLREQFAARNLAGSSFALREQAGVEAEFGVRAGEAKAEARAEVAQARSQIAQQRAQIFQVELQERARINQQRLGVVQTRIQTELAELGLTAEVQNSVNQLAARIALAQTGLEAQAAADRGAAVQGIFGGLDQVFGTGGTTTTDGTTTTPGKSIFDVFG